MGKEDEEFKRYEEEQKEKVVQAFRIPKSLRHGKPTKTSNSCNLIASMAMYYHARQNLFK